MTTPFYDPRTCEFVARMGRIPRPDRQKKEEKIPVMFRIPDPPDLESFKAEEDKESVHSDHHPGSVADSNNSLHDSQADLTSTQLHQSNEYSEKLTEEQQAFQRSQLDEIVAARQQQDREKELELMAQQMVNQTFLGKEISEMKSRNEMLRDIERRVEAPQPKDGWTKAIHVEKVQPELMEYIRRELKRLIPITKKEERERSGFKEEIRDMSVSWNERRDESESKKEKRSRSESKKERRNRSESKKEKRDRSLSSQE